MNSDLFWIEHKHDGMAASDGVSRYGVYVRQRIHGGFAECWDGTFEDRLAERFAALAWHTATSPVMAPPYADWRSPVSCVSWGLLRNAVIMSASQSTARLRGLVGLGAASL